MKRKKEQQKERNLKILWLAQFIKYYKDLNTTKLREEFGINTALNHVK